MKALSSSLQQRWSRLPRWVRLPVIGLAIITGLSVVTAGAVYHHFASEAARVDMDAMTHGQDETMLIDARGEIVGSVAYTGSIQPVQALLEARTAATVRLTTSAGLDKVHDWMQRWIVNAPLRKEAAFTLGQSAVSPLEMARAFTAIANNGTPCPKPSLFSSPRTNVGPVFTPAAANMVRETLLTSMSRPEYRRGLAQHGLAGRGIAGFGGIAYGGTDAWFVGFDRNATCVIWVGHDKDAPMSHTASTAALPLWAEAFSLVTNGQPQSWKARHMNEADIAVVRRATPISDDEVPAVVPASSAVIGRDAYAQRQVLRAEVAKSVEE